jgi:urease accessory protein
MPQTQSDKIRWGWAVRRAGFWNPSTAVDLVMLDAGDRHRRRIMLKGERGGQFLLDLDEAVALRDGDGIMLDDGNIVLVSGQAESLAEVTASTPLSLVRLAWHLGNRHADVQIAGSRLRIRRDHVLEEMVQGLGGRVTSIEASFDPEPSSPHQHGHGHAA